MKCVEMQTYVRLNSLKTWRLRDDYDIPTLIRESLSSKYINGKINVRLFGFYVHKVDFGYVGSAYKIVSVYDESLGCTVEEWKEICILAIKNVKSKLQIWEDIPIMFFEYDGQKMKV